MTTIPHPWRDARADAALLIEWSRALPADLLAVTDGDTVWMNTRQSQAERRVSITHELIHRERGHRNGCTGPEEEWVRQETARRLIPLDLLADAMRWSTDPFEIADHCFVDRDTVLTRLDHLHPTEIHKLRRSTEHHREDQEP